MNCELLKFLTASTEGMSYLSNFFFNEKRQEEINYRKEEKFPFFIFILITRKIISTVKSLRKKNSSILIAAKLLYNKKF